ncbi:hypothetical protein ACFRFJ_23530 [Streptomyces hydrogenans]
MPEMSDSGISCGPPAGPHVLLDGGDADDDAPPCAPGDREAAA